MTLYLNRAEAANVTTGVSGFNPNEMTVQIVRASGQAEVLDNTKNLRDLRGNYYAVSFKNASTGDILQIMRGGASWAASVNIELEDGVVALGPRDACPAAAELHQVLRTNIPLLAGKYKEVNGKMLDRLQLPSESGLTRHTAGLALDIVLFKSNPQERALAHHIFQLFLEYKHRINWLGLIYENTACNQNGQPLSYTKDNKHWTHIHIDWLIWESVQWKDNIVGGTAVKIPWPAVAHTTGFSAAIAEPLRDLNDQIASLQPLDLMKLSGLAA
jgi:hypothetical protein